MKVLPGQMHLTPLECRKYMVIVIVFNWSAIAVVGFPALRLRFVSLR